MGRVRPRVPPIAASSVSGPLAVQVVKDDIHAVITTELLDGGTFDVPGVVQGLMVTLGAQTGDTLQRCGRRGRWAMTSKRAQVLHS